MAIKSTFTLPASNTFEENVRLWAAEHNRTTEAGHGLFFDFSGFPEIKEPCLNYLIEYYGWVLENPYFIRKPE